MRCCAQFRKRLHGADYSRIQANISTQAFGDSNARLRYADAFDFLNARAEIFARN
jgi:hypothetical protein